MAKKASSRSIQMPTFRLREILNHPYCQGIDGKDYEPIKEELEAELWKREQKEQDELLKHRIREEKEYFKLMATAHKKPRNPVKNAP